MIYKQTLISLTEDILCATNINSCNIPLKLQKIEYNTSGFYLYFKIPKFDKNADIQTISTKVHLYSKEIQGGIGFVLYFKNKNLFCLEGFSYDDEITDLNFNDYELRKC